MNYGHENDKSISRTNLHEIPRAERRTEPYANDIERSAKEILGDVADKVPEV